MAHPIQADKAVIELLQTTELQSFQGDIVKQVTGGTVERAAASSSVPVVGVFNGLYVHRPNNIRADI